MVKNKKETDQKIMARLREPINRLVDQFCPNKTEEERLRLRQLAWQSVDVLARTGKVAGLNNQKDIKRILRNIREVGASEIFVKESLGLAISIYKRMQVYYPGLLERYKGK